MPSHKLWLPSVVSLCLAVGPAEAGQTPSINPSHASGFIGTWVIELIEPMKDTQTVKIWESNGALVASVGGANAPEKQVSAVTKDGNMLVLAISRDRADAVLENGVPIWAVYVLTLDGDTMKVALMLEQSRTIKRGTGKKHP